ncbi:restriction endonuclease subunit S [Methylotetracoccus oryzae]|uniref:restriction endonuclease subunit S n=1 Tax=Methylotetracoccus oryzae TaxID=1919059 RepID=UPI0013A5AE38|nr:restriction endonuclease subunit S [Methylotetracoccus oryzae]
MTFIFAPLGELASLQAGYGFPIELQGRASGDYPFAKVGDISRCGRSASSVLVDVEHYVDKEDLAKLRAKPIPAGSVLFAKIGEAIRQNHRVIAGCEMLVDNNAMAAIPNRKIDGRFLYHFLRTVDFYRLAPATTVPALRKSDLERLPTPCPPLSEQKRIATILDQADALRAKRREALEELDKLTQSIFIDMFGDPVANPRRWPDPKLGGLLTFQQYGPRFYNESYANDGIRIVRITDLNARGDLDFNAMPRLLVSDADRGKFALRPGDLIFARTGATVGKTALIQAADPPSIAGAYFITMRFQEALNPIYAKAVLTSPSVQAIVARRSRQAAQQNFSGPALRNLPMPLPPSELQIEFAHRIRASDNLRLVHCKSLSSFDSLFRSLQHRAFRGEL